MRRVSFLRALTLLSVLLSSSSTWVTASASLRDPSTRAPLPRSYSTHDYYVVEHNPSQGVSLETVARHLGVEIVERVGELEGVWLVRAPKPDDSLERRGDVYEELQKREIELGLDSRGVVAKGTELWRRDGFVDDDARDLTMRAYEEYEEELLRRDEQDDPVLRSYKDLRALKRSLRKRGSNSLTKREENNKLALASSITHLSKQHRRQLAKRAPPPIRPYKQPTTNAVMDKYDIMDPFFPMQWHLVNDRHPEHMMNVTPVWDMGYKGKGVITALIDDGLDSDSDDLGPNFDADNSYDFNDHVKSPVPKTPHDHHGTRCAGQIGAVKNGVCGIGIAHEGKVAGLRILGGRITLSDEAIALNFGYQSTSIYSCSWGPRDDGTKMQAPPYIVRKAVLNGINKGRGGKGSIFVFASGNGGHKGDQCNFDGYTNSIYSVTVGSIDWQGEHPRYSEMCAANMVVAYSSGGGEHIVTTDVGKNECALSHGGTSAAAPNVAGVIALALEARPDLTWRDVQHIAVYTARRVNEDDRGWQLNSNSGLYYSYKFGFGAMDASRYVQKAKDWKLVAPQAWFETETVQLDKGEMDEEEEFTGGTYIPEEGVTSKITITQTQVNEANLDVTQGVEGKGLEHVTVKVWIAHTRRGDVRVELISPNGVKSVLAAPRERDDAVTGFPGWTFMTVKHWAENPVGTWTIKVSDQASETETGAFLGWNMILWGSARDASKVKEKWQMDTGGEGGELENVLPPNRKPGRITPGRPEPPDHSGTKSMKPSETHEPPSKKPTDLPHDPSKPGDGLEQPSPSASGLLAGIQKGVQQKSWLAGFIFLLIVINVIAASYYCCWKPRNASSKPDGGDYGPLAGNEPIGMSNLRRGAGGYRDGEEDDDHADESTRLAGRSEGGAPPGGPPQTKPGPHPQARSTAGLGFHSGFLDDDDPLTAASTRSDMATPRNATATFGQPQVGELISTGEVPPVSAALQQQQHQARGVDDGKGKKAESESEEESEEESDEEEDDEEEEESEAETGGKGKGKAPAKSGQESSQSLI